ncbi:uncharacterized protein LOC124899477 [Capsicum annuum]|uniref:uncharacterized protein LOC124899477 n=1 Tax=Capsicum annuum TaxID=4072 RepID=UPI001FB152E5|nr:uncharacterized protein LOC124899477 [Capsicum annuum]
MGPAQTMSATEKDNAAQQVPTRTTQETTTIGKSPAQRQNVDVHISTQGGIVESRIKDFFHMNPPEFTGSKLTEDLQQFIDEAYKICKVMRVSDIDAVELAAHRLKDIAVKWYEMWVASRGQEASLVVRTEFAEAFIDHFMLLELREARMDEFLSLKQGNLSVKEYCLRFTKLSKYAPEVVSTQASADRESSRGRGPSSRSGPNRMYALAGR